VRGFSDIIRSEKKRKKNFCRAGGMEHHCKVQERGGKLSRKDSDPSSASPAQGPYPRWGKVGKSSASAGNHPLILMLRRV
jgi:hypothetical protein